MKIDSRWPYVALNQDGSVTAYMAFPDAVPGVAALLACGPYPFGTSPDWSAAQPVAGPPGELLTAVHKLAVIVANRDCLDSDEVAALGLDATGRDGAERFPYRYSTLSEDELTALHNWHNRHAVERNRAWHHYLEGLAK